jgi:hypothetical protein
MAASIKMTVFWDVALTSTSETSVNFYQTTWSATSQKTVIFKGIFPATQYYHKIPELLLHSKLYQSKDDV